MVPSARWRMPMTYTMEQEQSHSWHFCLTQEITSSRRGQESADCAGNNPFQETNPSEHHGVIAMEPISMCFFYVPCFFFLFTRGEGISKLLQEVSEMFPAGFETHRWHLYKDREEIKPISIRNHTSTSWLHLSDFHISLTRNSHHWAFLRARDSSSSLQWVVFAKIHSESNWFYVKPNCAGKTAWI